MTELAHDTCEIYQDGFWCDNEADFECDGHEEPTKYCSEKFCEDCSMNCGDEDCKAENGESAMCPAHQRAYDDDDQFCPECLRKINRNVYIAAYGAAVERGEVPAGADVPGQTIMDGTGTHVLTVLGVARRFWWTVEAQA